MLGDESLLTTLIFRIVFGHPNLLVSFSSSKPLCFTSQGTLPPPPPPQFLECCFVSFLSLLGTTFQAVANAIQQNNVGAPNLKHLSLACQVATTAAARAICFQLILKFNYFDVYLHTVVPVSPVCWSMAFFTLQSFIMIYFLYRGWC